MSKESRSYYAGKNKSFARNESPFVNVTNKNFSKTVPKMFMGHKERYDFRMPVLKNQNIEKIQSKCGSIDNKDKLKLFKYQKFVSAYVDPRTPYSCLIWHSVGSGKTMTMWHIIEGYLNNWHCKTDKKQIFLVCNPKQLEGFENELKLFDKITKIKKYLSRFSKSVKYGDKNRKARYGFTMKTNKQSVQVILLNLVEASTYARTIGFQNSVVIIDEAHNIANPVQTYMRYKKQFNYLAKHLSNCVSNKNVKVMPLTATPIKENISEISVLLNMVSKKIKFPVSEVEFMRKYKNNLELLKKDTRGLISYFSREYDYSVNPRKEINPATKPPVEIIVNSENVCPICFEQNLQNTSKVYTLPCGHKFCKQCVEKIQPIYDKRCPFCRAPFVMAALRDPIVFNRETFVKSFQNRIDPYKNYGLRPVRLGSEQRAKLERLREKHNKKTVLNRQRILSTFAGFGSTRVRENCPNVDEFLNQYGPKFIEIFNSIALHNKDKHWIYCGLSSSAGVTPMSETLLCKRMTQIPTETVKDCGSLLKDALNALSENKTPKLPGNNFNRFVVLETKTPKQISSMVLQILNHKENVSGKLIRVIIGDKSRKEGMDLFSIKHVHIVSPEIKYTDWYQAISRAVRYCSFKYVKSVKDWKIHLNMYVSHNHIPQRGNPRYTTEFLRQVKYDPDNYDKFYNAEILIVVKSLDNKENVTPFLDVLKEGAVDCYITAGFHAKEKIKCDMKVPVIRKPRPKISSNAQKEAYNKGYKNYNYKKGYNIGVKLSKTPTRTLIKKKAPKNPVKRYQFYGEQNAKFNAIMNGYKQI